MYRNDAVRALSGILSPLRYRPADNLEIFRATSRIRWCTKRPDYRDTSLSVDERGWIERRPVRHARHAQRVMRRAAFSRSARGPGGAGAAVFRRALHRLRLGTGSTS